MFINWVIGNNKSIDKFSLGGEQCTIHWTHYRGAV